MRQLFTKYRFTTIYNIEACFQNNLFQILIVETGIYIRCEDYRVNSSFQQEMPQKSNFTNSLQGVNFKKLDSFYKFCKMFCFIKRPRFLKVAPLIDWVKLNQSIRCVEILVQATFLPTLKTEKILVFGPEFCVNYKCSSIGQ